MWCIGVALLLLTHVIISNFHIWYSRYVMSVSLLRSSCPMCQMNLYCRLFKHTSYCLTLYYMNYERTVCLKNSMLLRLFESVAIVKFLHRNFHFASVQCWCALPEYSLIELFRSSSQALQSILNYQWITMDIQLLPYWFLNLY